MHCSCIVNTKLWSDIHIIDLFNIVCTSVATPKGSEHQNICLRMFCIIRLPVPHSRTVISGNPCNNCQTKHYIGFPLGLTMPKIPWQVGNVVEFFERAYLGLALATQLLNIEISVSLQQTFIFQT